MLATWYDRCQAHGNQGENPGQPKLFLGVDLSLQAKSKTKLRSTCMQEKLQKLKRDSSQKEGSESASISLLGVCV